MPLPIFYDEENVPIPNRSLDTPEEIQYLNAQGFNMDSTNFLYDVFNRAFDLTREHLENQGLDEEAARDEALGRVDAFIEHYDALTGTPLQVPDNYVPQHDTFSERQLPIIDLTGESDEEDAPPNVIPVNDPPPLYDLTPAPQGVNRVGDDDTDVDSEADDDTYYGSGFIHPHYIRPFFSMNK